MKNAILAIAMFITSTAFAGGSISREDALSQVAAENKELATLLAKMPLADVGDAVRAGKHTGMGGQRLMPFTFTTRDNKLTVVIGFDEDGKVSASIK